MAIAFFSAVVIRGGKNPLVVESACKIALAWAVEAPTTTELLFVGFIKTL